MAVHATALSRLDKTVGFSNQICPHMLPASGDDTSTMACVTGTARQAIDALAPYACPTVPASLVQRASMQTTQHASNLESGDVVSQLLKECSLDMQACIIGHMPQSKVWRLWPNGFLREQSLVSFHQKRLKYEPRPQNAQSGGQQQPVPFPCQTQICQTAHGNLPGSRCVLFPTPIGVDRKRWSQSYI